MNVNQAYTAGAWDAIWKFLDYIETIETRKRNFFTTASDGANVNIGKNTVLQPSRITMFQIYWDWNVSVIG